MPEGAVRLPVDHHVCCSLEAVPWDRRHIDPRVCCSWDRRRLAGRANRRAAPGKTRPQRGGEWTERCSGTPRTRNSTRTGQATSPPSGWASPRRGSAPFVIESGKAASGWPPPRPRLDPLWRSRESPRTGFETLASTSASLRANSASFRASSASPRTRSASRRARCASQRAGSASLRPGCAPQRAGSASPRACSETRRSSARTLRASSASQSSGSPSPRARSAPLANRSV